MVSPARDYEESRGQLCQQPREGTVERWSHHPHQVDNREQVKQTAVILTAALLSTWQCLEQQL